MANAGTVYPSLKGRTVFVTGGASGIGEAFVRAFHAQGCQVAFVDLAAEAGEALAAALGAGARFEVCDVTVPGALERTIQAAAAAFGPVTVLINNVAHDARQEATAITPETWRAALAINLDPAALACVAAYPGMKAAGGGAMINVSSINALLGPPDLAAYSAAKGAVNALTKSLARAWGPDRIRVNALSPGWVATPRQLALWLTPEAEAAWSQLTALPGRIEAEDIARAALFLASDEARMITGQNLIVDAGRT
jgi:NAD(P)-dependent dehydrogenase (short-subunit alcohol dehydrogenase family)